MKIFRFLKSMCSVLVLSAIVFFSCDASSDIAEKGNSFQKTAHETSNARVHSSVYTFTGNVEFWNNTSAREFGLFFTDSNGAYHYMLVENITLSTTFSNGQYRLELYEDGLVLTRQSTPASLWFIGVNNTDSSDLLDDLNDDTTFVGSDLTGRSLLHSWGPPSVYDNKSMLLVRQAYNSLSLFLYRGGGTRTCDSGGAGSKSCSQTDSDGSCSVTCSSGYYACCKEASPLHAASCKCYANGS